MTKNITNLDVLKVEHLVEQGDLDEALNILKDWAILSRKKKKKEEVIILKCEYNKTKNKYHLGLISFKKLNRHENRLAHSILYLLEYFTTV
ncbi:MAG TPA: hypothetical protein PKC40_03340 [Saprospiraceae bacterium]|nr:hypothetical protein [Saprospiraceae bacterium]